ncbi:hypothetical protein SKAU_G00156150 [Synaphobranchus kaupii]|uniref:Uncharacterized protein n=1 Tax=Synaphobranchus kaupii TaxID=118154 RepID=A0A9Q1FI59_SYNKA|nr:hypothetical protein SKAU_G00156150 [Synaphobranchus kaupii]
MQNGDTPCAKVLQQSAFRRALRNCGGIECREDQRCCTPGNSSAATVSCCQVQLNTFFDNLDWITRKLSGILILLLLFAMGYFIQRIVCPRPRRQGDGQLEPTFLGGGATTSQDNLLESVARHSLEEITSPVLLPAYDEVKDLPTYEETMQEAHGRRAVPTSVQLQHCLHPLSTPRTFFG